MNLGARLTRLEAERDARLLTARPDTLSGPDLDRAIELQARRLRLGDPELSMWAAAMTDAELVGLNQEVCALPDAEVLALARGQE